MNHIFLNGLQIADHGSVLCALVLSVKDGTFYFYGGLIVLVGLAIELSIVTCSSRYRFSDRTLHKHAASLGLSDAWAARFTLIVRHWQHLLLLVHGSLPLWINHNDRFLRHCLIRFIFLTKARLLRVSEPWIRPILGGVMPTRLRMILCRLSHGFMLTMILLVIDSWPSVCTILAVTRVDDFVYQAIIGECFRFTFRTPI